MANVRVKNGTPYGNESLCRTCTHVHMQKGYRESEELIFCYFGPLRLVPFKVSECSDYREKALSRYEDMVKMAWIIDVKSEAKAAGFKPRGVGDTQIVQITPAPPDDDESICARD